MATTHSRSRGRRPFSRASASARARQRWSVTSAESESCSRHAWERQRARDVVHRDAQHLLVLVAAQRAETILEERVGAVLSVPGERLEPLLELEAEGLGALHRDEGVLVEQRIEQLGVAQEALRQEVGAAEEREEQACQPVLAGEQPEVGLGIRQGGGEVGEEAERLVGIGGRQRLLQQRDRRSGIAVRREGRPAPPEGVERGERAVGVGEPAPQRNLRPPLVGDLRVGEERQLGVELDLARAEAEQVGEEAGDALAVLGRAPPRSAPAR